jgi:hypothetical protein
MRASVVRCWWYKGPTSQRVCLEVMAVGHPSLSASLSVDWWCWSGFTELRLHHVECVGRGDAIVH